MPDADPAATPVPAPAIPEGSTPSTRERLIAAAIDLFADKGYEGTSVGELESERQLARIVMKEGDRFPEIAADFHDAIVARGRAISIAWFTSRAAALGVVPADPEATAEVMADALIGRTLQSFMFGERLGPIDEERSLDAWVRFSRTALESREGTG